MGFSLFEISNRLGRPVALYEFAWGPTIYRYTSADRTLEYGGEDWEAVAISDSGFTLGQDQQDFIVTLPRRLPICDLFRSTPPSTPIWLTCRYYHKDDPDAEAIVYWVGTVGNIRGKDRISAEVLGLSIGRTTKRTGLRASWETGCIHALYGPGCYADKELFKTVAEITALTGNTVTVDTIGAHAGASYAGGFLEWVATVEGAIDRRPIESFDGGTTFTLLSNTARLEVGQEVSLYLGCDLTAETCLARFDNLENFGGFPFMPKNSPFDGNPVF